MSSPPGKSRARHGVPRILGALSFAALLGGLVAGIRDLPRLGDPASPASTHVSPRFIEAAARETGAANMVTAVLADYRGYDTLGETAVIFAAGLGCLILLALAAADRRETPPPGLAQRFGSPILDVSVRVLTPWILMFALYVLIHGHVSPGGGFQGGVLFGSGLLAVRLVRGRAGPAFGPGPRAALVVACAGVLACLGIGFLAMAFGGEFLDYGTLPLGGDEAHVRELATLGVEAAVFAAVAGTVSVLFRTISVGAAGPPGPDG